MHIGIFAFDAPLVTRFGNPFPGGCVTTVESHFFKQLIHGSKKLRLLLLLKEFLMLLGSVSQKEAATGGEFEGAQLGVRHRNAGATAQTTCETTARSCANTPIIVPTCLCATH